LKWAVGSWQSAVGSGQWAVGSWQLAVGRRCEAVGNGIEDLWNLDVT